mmetsp:Transcript_19965/g.32911  ORF Transcript_19965/g.32911 Transcript_19965/m.32911 type:complete len:528 (+) Transcript_19965:102-1685(+)
MLENMSLTHEHDHETGRRKLVDNDGVFVLVLEDGSRRKMSGLSIEEGVGLRCGSENGAGMSIHDMVGVHRSGNLLRFVGYSLEKGGCLCSGESLVRHEIQVLACGKNTEAENELVCTEWYVQTLSFLGRTEKSMEKPILVLINPKSGPGHSTKIWMNTGNKVICQDAGHRVEVVTTERANHALELISTTKDLCGKYKGIVIVSGDGLMYETLQGIMQRKDWAHCVRWLPVGILPGGSGNGLAKSINEQASLPHSPLSSSFVVAKNHVRALDVAAVDIGTNDKVKRVYSFLSLAWAIASDIDIGSEYMRSLGESRFTIEAIKRFINLRKYNGRLSYLPCTEGQVGQLPRSGKDETVQTPPTYWELHGEQVDAEAAPAPILNLVPNPDEPVPENWHVVEDTFWSMWNCNVEYMSGSASVAPHAKLDDGYWQLSYLRENGYHGMSKGKLLDYLLGLDSGKHQEKDFVEMTPTQAYRFEPLPNPNGKTEGIIALDGEVVEYTQLQMQILRGFLKVYAFDPNAVNSSVYLTI